MNLEQALVIITSPEAEGGYSNNPKDPGGETKFGISKRAFPYLDIKNLTLKDVEPIYRKHYWDEVKADGLPDYLRLIVFDSAINQGVSAAVGMLQKILSLPVDGVMGPKTLDMVSKADKLKTLEKYGQARFNRYIENKKWDDFGKGWCRRLTFITFRSFEILRG